MHPDELPLANGDFAAITKYAGPLDHWVVLPPLRLNSLAGLLLGRQGLSGPPRYTSWSWRAAKESVAKLAELDPIVLAGGHGMPMTGAGAAGALRAFADQFTGRVAKPNGKIGH